MRYKVLGPFEVHRGDEDLTPTAPRLKEILALLVVRHNHVVAVRELVDELWGSDPPTTAVSTLQTYVYRLRRLFAGRRPTDTIGVLRTKGDGYLLEIPPDDVDLHHFTRLAGQGREALEAGDAERASTLCAEALALWSGATALGGVTTGDLLAAQITRLEEMRLRALEIRIEADLQRGEHGELISELKGLTVTHPLHEAFHGQLMLALHRANRRCEALSTYRRLRESMIGELGLEPSGRLRELQQAMLVADPALDVAPRTPAVAAVTGPLGPPAQLPPDIADFVGRATQLEFAGRLLAHDNRVPAIPIVSISGMPGIGKSTLAVRMAHHARAVYPDGQLYADLGGASPRPSDPGEVLGQFLRGIGLAEQHIPSGVDERATLFRTWTADRKVLVVLDDAVSAAQVRSLLPGGEHCGVVITGRKRIFGLAAAHQLEVLPLSGKEAGELLGELIGRQRLAAEPTAARRIALLCGHLPLAIRGVAARLVCGSESLASVCQRLRPEPTRLDELRFSEFDLRARLRSAVRVLDPRLRTALAGLARLAVPTFTVDQAGDALGGDPAGHRRLLDGLMEHSLLRVTGYDQPGQARFCLHPLVRLYGREELAGAEHASETILVLPAAVTAPPGHNGSHAGTQRPQ